MRFFVGQACSLTPFEIDYAAGFNPALYIGLVLELK